METGMELDEKWTKHDFDEAARIYRQTHQRYHVYIQERTGSNVHLGDIVAWDFEDARRQAIGMAKQYGWPNPQRAHLDRI